ncbi:hypothetical protein [Parafilimonas terrae]|uniref:Uncharacterized protein n=1 Tax=Parafilimonas terrae TaxID=1465490 RepID=A0A1I5UBJ0_9BACT|nr:hypothetical protein [Parafilimonas terrae]SFP92660.1 hypothetical protein SAMN05444277_103188 [Parafilimonas terrae]
MTIENAIKQLIISEEFKAAAKLTANAKLRVYLGRYKKGTLSECGSIELLKQFGYTIEARKARNKK